MPSIWTSSPALMALYVAFNALIVLMLNMLVSREQAKAVGGTNTADRATLVHAASALNLPIPLLLMLTATSLGAAPWLIHAIGAPLTLGQLLQGFGGARGENAPLARHFERVLVWMSYIAGIAATIWLIFAR
jgi:uncharacterized membrane protein YecN with MAPEG domain